MQNHYLVTFYLPNLNGGGIQRSVLNLAHEFTEQGISVDIIVDRFVGSFVTQVPSKVKVIDLGSPRLRSRIPKLMRYLRRKNPTALVSNAHYNNEIAVLSKHLARVSTKVIVVTQNSPHGKFQTSFKKPLAALGMSPENANTFVRLFFPFASGIVASSKGVAEDLAHVARLTVDRIQVIYNPIVTPNLLEQSKEPVEHPWVSEEKLEIILGVGRLVPQKDFLTLVHAFAAVRKERAVKLIILGSGPAKSQIETLVSELGLSEHVALLGHVKNPYSYMSKASVFVLSSAWEGFGNVLVEAMAVNTPVVSTNCKSGPAEILDNGKYGHLVAVGDSEAMAEAMLKVLQGDRRETDPSWLYQFSLGAVAQKYLEMMDIT